MKESALIKRLKSRALECYREANSNWANGLTRDAGEWHGQMTGMCVVLKWLGVEIRYIDAPNGGWRKPVFPNKKAKVNCGQDRG